MKPRLLEEAVKALLILLPHRPSKFIPFMNFLFQDWVKRSDDQMSLFYLN
jgi:hypothetical protein